MDVICAHDFIGTGMMYTDHSGKWHLNGALARHVETKTVDRRVCRHSPCIAVCPEEPGVVIKKHWDQRSPEYAGFLLLPFRPLLQVPVS